MLIFDTDLILTNLSMDPLMVLLIDISRTFLVELTIHGSIHRMIFWSIPKKSTDLRLINMQIDILKDLPIDLSMELLIDLSIDVSMDPSINPLIDILIDWLTPPMILSADIEIYWWFYLWIKRYSVIYWYGSTDSPINLSLYWSMILSMDLSMDLLI